MLNFLIRIIYISLTIIVVIGLIKFYTPFNENDYKRIVNKGVIVAGIRTGPSSYYEVKTQKIGFTYDVLEELSKFDYDEIMQIYEKNNWNQESLDEQFSKKLSPHNKITVFKAN